MREPRKPDPPVTKILMRFSPLQTSEDRVHGVIPQAIDDGRIGRLPLRCHIENGGGMRGGPGKVCGSLRWHRKPPLRRDSFDVLHVERTRLLGGWNRRAKQHATDHRGVKPWSLRRKTHVVVPALPQRNRRIGRLLRDPLGFKKLLERFCDCGAQQSVGATEMMVEGGRSDVRDRAYRTRRELCGAFLLKDLQSRSHQRFARIHSSTIAMLYYRVYSDAIGAWTAR